MRKVICSAILSASLAQPASAGLLYSNGPVDLAVPDAVSGDLAGGNPYPFRISEIADDFVLASDAAISRLTWWGGYADSNTPISDNFRVRIYASDPTGPAESSFSEANINAIQRAPTGFTFTAFPFEPSGFSVYAYSANIDPISLLAGDTYWLSVVNNTNDDFDDSWFWSVSQGAAGNGQRRLDGFGTFYQHEGLSGRGSEFAFELFEVSTQVPGPLSASLFGLGILIMWSTSRRRVVSSPNCGRSQSKLKKLCTVH